MAKETENKDLDPETTLKGVTFCLENPKISTYYVAYVKSDDPNDP